MIDITTPGVLPMLVDWINYLTDPTRLKLVAAWIVLVVISVLWCALAPLVHAPICIKRKLFHLTGSAIFVSGILVDIRFLNLAAVVALLGFVLAEIVRLRGPRVLSELLENALSPFLYVEERSGIVTVPFILPHVYLLLGLSIPVWLDGIVNRDPVRGDHTIAAYAGVVTVGVGDSFAAVVGKSFGRRKWPGQNKTVEGSAAMLTAMFVVTELFVRIDPVLIPLMDCIQAHRMVWILQSVFATSLEAFVPNSDNVLVPLLSFFTLSFASNAVDKQLPCG